MTSLSRQRPEEIRAEYQQRHTAILEPLAANIGSYLRERFAKELRIDQISARPKAVDRFLAKAAKVNEKGEPKYPEPLENIQDQIGARIVTFYLADVERIERLVTKYFRAIEDKPVTPERDSEFSYFGHHYILFFPSDVIDPGWDKKLVPRVFELQVKTLFQHAWSEAEHDLGYKPGKALTKDQRRRFAFTSAQAWGADRIFNELFAELST